MAAADRIFRIGKDEDREAGTGNGELKKQLPVQGKSSERQLTLPQSRKFQWTALITVIYFCAVSISLVCTLYVYTVSSYCYVTISAPTPFDFD